MSDQNRLLKLLEILTLLSGNVHRLIDAIEQKKQVVLKEYQSGNSATIRDKKFRNNKLLSYQP
jgi:hypothetical protein